MGFAIEMFFDKKTEGILLEYWKSLYETGLSKELYESGSRPHISLAVYNDIDLDALNNRLPILLEGKKPFELRFESVGIFPTDPSVVFLAPGMTDNLYEIHKEYHTVMTDFLEKEWSYYLPNKWVPHCAMAMGVPRESVSEVVDHIMNDFRQCSFTIEEVGIVEFRPVKHRKAYKLKR